jgi:hypothetical protein
MKTKLCFILLVLFIPHTEAIGQEDYLDYHRAMIRSEQLIAEQRNNEAIDLMDSLFHRYEFVFLRDCKLASAIAAFEQDTVAAIFFVKRGILQGWTWNSIKKDKNLKAIQSYPEWNDIQQAYDSLHMRYMENINTALRTEIHERYKKDQKMALKALFRIGDKSQIKYAERKFAPHSEKQMAYLNNVLQGHFLIFLISFMNFSS